MNIFLEYDRLRKALENNAITAEDVQVAQHLAESTKQDKYRVLFARIKRSFAFSQEEPTQENDAAVVTKEQVDDAANAVKQNSSIANRAKYASLKRQYQNQEAN